MPYSNKPVSGAYQYFPLNEPEIGERIDQKEYDPKLFQPLVLRGVSFKNRIFASPMCQYSAKDGHVTDWHLVHLGGYATRGVGAICAEATAVVPEGRISPEDAGIWDDSHVEPFRRVVDFSTSLMRRAKAGKGTSHVTETDEGGWLDNIRGPSTIPFSDNYGNPHELSIQEIDALVDAFVAGAQRSDAAGFDFIEIHGAHGYLIHEFLSPLSNNRTDEYGGSFENRIRFLLRVVKASREAWSKPLFVRIRATDWVKGPEKDDNGQWRYWGPDQSKILAQVLSNAGVDLLDVSSGGLWVGQEITIEPGYQVPFSRDIKKTVPGLVVGAVGLIAEAEQAEGYLQNGDADVIFIARELLRNPHWPLYAAKKLGVAVKAANQYDRVW